MKKGNVKELSVSSRVDVNAFCVIAKGLLEQHGEMLTGTDLKRETVSVPENTKKDLAHDAEERDAKVIIAVTVLPLVLTEGDNVGITHVLGDVALLPAQAQEFVKML